MASETTTAEALEHAAEAPGMPQIDFTTFPNQMFWLVVTLVVIYFVLARVALPRIAGILSDRAGTISGDIAAAEELKQRAVEAEEAYLKALAEARVQASEIAVATRADIHKNLDAALVVADAQIAEKTGQSKAAIAEVRAGALAAVDQVARDAAAAIVAALGGKADSAAVSRAVAQRLKG